MKMRGKATYALFGAAPDTSNRGVSALFRCVIEGVGNALPDSSLLVFDSGPGMREDSTVLESGVRYDFSRIEARGGRRYYASGNLATVAAVSLLGRSVGRLHPVVSSLDRCSAVLDVSGGDSFSDIYGSHRFWSVVRPKLIARRLGIPLFLMPQTYGPFRSDRTAGIARRAVLASTMAWARDPRSFQALKDLLGADFDPSRHREGVDMAFNLGSKDPGEKLGDDIRQWIDEKSRRPLVGLNVSGMIALNRDWAHKDFQLRANYVEALTSFVRTLMRDTKLRVVFIPHVMSRLTSLHSDAAAGHKIIEQLEPELRSRAVVAPRTFDEREVKWLISKMDWFCGTRMHSTIAALSSGVPTATVPYSDKALGVFQSCGVDDQVIDPRRLDTQMVVDKLVESFERRAETKEALSGAVGRVKARAVEQMRITTDMLEELS